MLAALSSGCADDAGPTATPTSSPTPARSGALDRSLAVQRDVVRWAEAKTLTEAKASAERARNLITGPDVREAGDADGDGELGTVAVGLLPGEGGKPGLASPVVGECVRRDVLGGSWSDPVARWEEVYRRIEQWAPDNNTFPALLSHAQRVVGWASLTIQADRLAQAREFSGHAALHADVVVDALRTPQADPCPGG